MKSIDFVLPAYNEEEGIGAFHAALTAAIEPLQNLYHFRMIYVLDRSADNTFGILKELAARSGDITVLHLSRRFGHQMSLVAGIDHSDADGVIMMDCDQQHPPKVVPLLLEKFEEGYDIVHTVREYDFRTGFLKRSTSQLFYRIQNILSPVDLPAGTADFRLISRRVATVFRTSIREQNQFLRGLFRWIGFNAATIPYTAVERHAGRTKYQFGRLLAFAIAGMLSFSKLPLRVASLVGVAVSTLSLVYGIFLIIVYFWAGRIPRGYTSLIVVVLFMGGLQLTVLGIIGEYLGSIFDEVKGRPLYVVDEIVRSESS
jgi:dolichol-phosphate mannosyltransferase